jgi:hypothetical protein
LRVFEDVEIGGTFGNEKEKGTGRQTDYYSRKDDVTVSYLEGLEFSPRPGNKLSLERFFAGFLSPCRASPVQHVFTKQAMTSATCLIFFSEIIFL